MHQSTAALMALSALAANEPSSLEKLQMIRQNAPQKRKTSGEDRSKIKAARKQRRKQTQGREQII